LKRQIFFKQITPTMRFISEEFAYETSKWFAEIGGVSNFMMGVSVLTFFRFIDIVCVRLYALIF
jgi:hypothetical protein